MQRPWMSTRASLRGLIAATVLATGCGKPPAAAPPAAAAPEVGVIEVRPRRVAITTELAGRVSAHLVAEVRPQVGGIVQERRFTEGGDVRAGDVLYRIDAAPYQAARDSALAALAKAKAALASALAARAAAATAQAGARAALSRASADAVPRRLKAERYAELVAMNAVSRQDADDAAAALKQAEAAIQGAEAALAGTGADAARADAAVQAAEADIAGAEAALAQARINLARTEVTAPISGRVGRSSVTTGALVTANQAAALATIQQLDPAYVDATESAANILRMRESLTSGRLMRSDDRAAVRLVLENGAAYPHAGTLKFSDVTVQPGTGSVTVRTVFPNPELLLLPGMFVRAVVEEGVSEAALLVPQRGVTRNPKGEAVAMVVGAGEKAEARVLKIERGLGDDWLVSEGLAAGDRVILEGLQRVRPGSPVKAAPFGAPAAAPPAPTPAK